MSAGKAGTAPGRNGDRHPGTQSPTQKGGAQTRVLPGLPLPWGPRTCSSKRGASVSRSLPEGQRPGRPGPAEAFSTVEFLTPVFLGLLAAARPSGYYSGNVCLKTNALLLKIKRGRRGKEKKPQNGVFCSQDSKPRRTASSASPFSLKCPDRTSERTHPLQISPAGLRQSCLLFH